MSQFHSESVKSDLQLTIRVKFLDLSVAFNTVEKSVSTCLETGQPLAASAFEEHLDACPVCSNRVELQLDFMECLEAAVYQRLSEPESRKVHGALMISAPRKNFAICGELEVG